VARDVFGTYRQPDELLVDGAGHEGGGSQTHSSAPVADFLA
jgi:hypothetical protein